MEDVYASLNLPGQRRGVMDARLWKRLAAFVADILLLQFVALGPLTGFLPASFTTTLSGAAYAAAVTAMLLALGYFALFEYLLGQTPGMMLLNIQAVNVTLARALVRNSFLLPVFPFPLLWLVEPLHLLWKRTRLLEVLTGTRTVEQVAL